MLIKGRLSKYIYICIPYKVEKHFENMILFLNGSEIPTRSSMYLQQKKGEVGSGHNYKYSESSQAISLHHEKCNSHRAILILPQRIQY